jgi:hypothetical protein
MTHAHGYEHDGNATKVNIYLRTFEFFLANTHKNACNGANACTIFSAVYEARHEQLCVRRAWL